MTNHDDYDAQSDDDFTESPDADSTATTNGDTHADSPPETYQPLAPQPERTFEDLTLAEAFSQWVRKPRSTTSELVQIARTPVYAERTSTAPVPALPPPPQKREAPEPVEDTESKINTDAYGDLKNAPRHRVWIRAGLFVAAFVVAWYGNLIFVDSEGVIRSEDNQLARGIPFVIMAFLMWLGAEAFWSWGAIKAQFSRNTEALPNNEHDLDQDTVTPNQTDRLLFFDERLLIRSAFFAGAVLLSGFTWLWTSDNTFTFGGGVAWIASTILIVMAFMPFDARPMEWVSDKLSSIQFKLTPTLAALVAIMLFGAYFRFENFDTTPPEMTSDHVEKILDAQRVFEGDYDVFFANNGGREPFQMYAIALLSNLPGFGMNHETIMFLAVIESLITLPILWWMGREVIGERDRRLGNIVGLSLMALVAVSYWHLSITRLALRIVLTPMVAALIVIYLSKAMRHNRRVDFIICGLILGFGLYTYQAVRMLPVVIVVGVFLAILFQARNQRDRLRYMANLAVLVMVSAVVFMPLFRYWDQYPESFWQRTAGRLLGDDIIIEYDEDGNPIGERNATIEERMDAFTNNMSALTNNIRNALLMYNWKGDVAFINGAPNQPQMDPLTGGLLIIGVAAWLALLIRWRDPVILLMPVMLLIMLLPSALSIAMTIENPSATRTSGSLPPAYLIAGFGMGVLIVTLRNALGGKVGGLVSASLATVIILGAYVANSDTYFNDFQEAYISNALPYSEAGDILEGFAQSDGTYGNAFMIAYQHWWDHRAVGIEAGITDWTNGVISREQLPDSMYDVWRCGDNPYRLNPERDLLIFYNQNDNETTDYLFDLFPDGRVALIDSYQPGDDFNIFRVPALGIDGMVEFDQTYVTERRC